ncbi:MAG TPA: tetratricopeptide repeat protein, partial [Treponemataceae bacterium]|nr:tetratricopeptide repeat protein [Treponemataceae bacterium]
MKKPLAFILCIFIPQLFFADAVLLYNAGKKMQDKGEWYSAIEKYQEALVSNSTYAEAYKGLAECFYGLGEYSQALSYVNKAESLRKKNPDLITLRGFILIGLSKIDDAKKDFETVLAALPNNASARFGLAEIELLSGRISSAAAYYSEA